ncbi:MAG: MSMEG_4193 family putative phosphomutase [Chloroflexi bacterium]|jgi:probable phosphoglycerate mutase|nr:MSMEG_4193 family putative phosphomutase [Chloroflexota bacterium]MDL1882354.1 MSMEG_4193 family putative phosphomutase [Anaerolineae bacterium CFX8]GIL11615.1 MAG: phosphoglycerate mutase [Chloroflexota bacterium]
MTHILLIRHAVNDYVKTGKLAGWTPGVHLNEEGLAQAEALGQRLADAPIQHLYSSPLERTMETAQAIQKHHPHLTIRHHAGIGEVRYGDWEGQEISKLSQRKMWHVVQHYPSRAGFPNGETMRGVQERAVNAIEELVAAHPRDMVAVVSHADLIKMILAHYLGMHLDAFQRIVVSPASISTLSLGYGRPYVAAMNDIAHVLQLERERRQAKQEVL